MPHIDLAKLLLISVITAVGSALQATVGFGLGVIAGPLFMLLDPAFVPGPILVSSLLLMIMIVIRDHKHVDLRGLHYAVVGRIVGTAPEDCLLAIVSQRLFDLIFGTMVIIGVVMSRYGKPMPMTRLNSLLAGVASGFMSTTSSIGSPPIALQYQNGDPEKVRGTLAGFFIFGTLISIIGLAIAGRFGWHEIKLTVFMIPAVVLGFLCSKWLIRRLDKKLLRPIILWLSFASGLLVLLRGIF